MELKTHQKLYNICNDYNGQIKDSDLQFVQQQWGLITTYIKEKCFDNTVVKIDGIYYNSIGEKMQLFCGGIVLEEIEKKYQGKMIIQFTSKEYESMFLPF